MDVYLYHIIYSIKYHNINVYGMNIIYIYICYIIQPVWDGTRPKIRVRSSSQIDAKAKPPCPSLELGIMASRAQGTPGMGISWELNG